MSFQAMTWDETVASRCRYGDIAGRLFDGATIIYEHSEADYQGYASVFGQLRDGRFCHYEWSYGSCSGCDEWEAVGLSDDDIEKVMRDAAVYFDDEATVRRYLKLDGEFTDARVPTANSQQNGSIPGMLRYLTGGIGEDFRALGVAFTAFQQWKSGQVQADGRS